MILLRTFLVVLLCQLLLTGCSLVKQLDDPNRPSLEECSYSSVIETRKLAGENSCLAARYI